MCTYLDFAKAFDTVVHERLLVKLIKQIDITGTIERWIRRYLSVRVVKVVISGCSPWKVITGGVPQGSVVEPVLFLLCVNDLPERMTAYVNIYVRESVDPLKTCGKLGQLVGSFTGIHTHKQYTQIHVHLACAQWHTRVRK